jgi:hypothetical protein
MARFQSLHNISSRTYHTPRPKTCVVVSPVKKGRKQQRSPVVVPVSNLPKLDHPSGVIPTEHEFELMRLARAISDAKDDIRRLNDKISRQLAILQEGARLWELGLQKDQWPTLGEAIAHKRRIEAAIKYEGAGGQTDDLLRNTPVSKRSKAK